MMDTLVSAVENMLKSAGDWLTLTYNAPSTRAVVFGVPIGGHLFLEGLLFVVIVYLLSQKSYKPPKRPLTRKEIDELCDEWVPEPLIPSIDEELKYEPPVLESAAGPHAIINGKDVVNFTSANYLGLLGQEKLQDSCTKALEKYGVGSCGPRGFYGTIDVHLDCETKIAKFLGTYDSILYSYGLSTMFSIIPAFCKKGDVVVVDEGVHWGIQNGLHLSRSTIIYFKHNDMESLRSTLEKVTQDNKRAKKLRRYIIVEAVYQNSGQIAPLDEIIKLKEKYRFRVILDESNSFGVLGSSGRGLTEHCKVPVEKVDIITAAMGNALATEGGFCAGSARVVDHQRLSSSGYVFSASLPPYLASAAITALDVLEENPDLITKLKKNIATLHKGLSDVQNLKIVSDPQSPVVYLTLKKSMGSFKGDFQMLEDIADRVLKKHSVFVATSKRSTVDKCKLPAGIRLLVSAGHTESDLVKACEAIKSVAAETLSGVFSGNLSLDLNEGSKWNIKRGGFCGMRSKKFDGFIDLDGYDELALKLKGDGRCYISTIYTENWVNSPGQQEDNSWQAFVFVPKDNWYIANIPLARYLPTWRGNVIDAELEMNPGRVVGISFSVNAEGGVPGARCGPGDFRVEIDWIKALRTQS